MNIKPSNKLVKNSLNAHTWIGLTVGVLMYLVCLSGAIVVFFEEFERWEQPNVEEYLDYNPQLIAEAVKNFQVKADKTPDSIYVVLPNEAVPRIHVAGDGKEWFVNKDGSLGEKVKEGWTHMLKGLHIKLHLPQTLGLIIVGSLGAMLCALIISGLIAHPRIFKDAFTLRIGGNKRLEQADLHNRLSVWGTPFYLMIGVTGAFIGLVSILIAVAAPAYFDGDREAVVAEVYGGDPLIKNGAGEINYQRAFDELKKVEPDASPIYLVVQKANTDKQYLEIAATLPGRFVYSEMYRFKTDGSFIDYQHLSDGSVGQQVAYSVYRLHFGHFDNGWIKILYGVLGLALTVIAASGINIWLARRKFRSFVNDAWVAIVWGTPLALAASFSLGNAGISYELSFWLLLILTLSTSIILRNESKSKIVFQMMTSLFIILSIVQNLKVTLITGMSEAILFVNLGLFVTSMFLMWMVVSKLKMIKNRTFDDTVNASASS